MDVENTTTRILDAAEAQFYERGIQAVGMDAIRSCSGVSLKRLYQCFPSKERLVEAYLTRRDQRWRAELGDYVRAHAGTPGEAPLVVFDWLAEWFARPAFRGCAFINSFGELGGLSTVITEAVRHHKNAVHAYLRELVGAAGLADPDTVSTQLLILVEGATVVAAVSGDATAATTSRATAEAVLATARRGEH